VILSLFKQNHYMTRILVLSLFAFTVLVSCVSSGPYRPATPAEKHEFARDRLDVYPDDFRKDPAAHAGTAVVWAGIICSTDAHEKDQGDQIMADSVFEHHYFDWVQDSKGGCLKLSVSPRGEGLFRARWYMDKTQYDATAESAEGFAKPGTLAIVYGVPETVDANGTVVLKYRYLRIVDADHFTTNEFDYGRLGEPFRELHPKITTNAPSAQQPIKGP
jgi:hypothetical protein